MDTVSMVIVGLLGALIIFQISPGIIAANRGKMLRNIALWLAIFLVLALVYRNFGPGKHEEIMPQSISSEESVDKSEVQEKEPEQTLNEDDYTPPRE